LQLLDFSSAGKRFAREAIVAEEKEITTREYIIFVSTHEPTKKKSKIK